ncbi:NAD-dependent succinate-semialdehyde dehydrogenase [Streptomyces sp. NPDC039016]|uniref:NAD-dependent succinate-semialdehyde dehydrogenase n=1 Tax=Streptomyces sp. NPDC039016 TaxID=3154330 RepID=UPI000C2765A7|nr:NAD-dependent succinate-semialdehyde dehydrogenase [Streptomyces sp. CB02959]PJN40232.1 succinate-semialdehyde dehydrogenase [Streptomyces sp. CB02959]
MIRRTPWKEDRHVTQYAVTDPSTGKLVQTYPTATDAEIAAAVDAAAAAYDTWGRISTVADRTALLRRVAELHRERSAELAAAMVEEMGKPLSDAEGEVGFSAAIYDYYADNAAKFLADEPIQLGEGQGTAVIRRMPVGVLLGIMPWNFPAYQVARFAAPNLATGNTVVLKHAPQCPRSAALLQQIFLDAGFPEGAYVNVYATNDQVAAIIADPRVQGVSLTGSERAGAAVAEIAGRHLKKVVLELGGSDPFVVLGSDDLDATVQAAVAARLDNTGQACNAAKRIIVHQDLYDDFVSRFTDEMLAARSAPLSSVAAAERLEQQVARALSEGASLASAGERDGAHYPAGVLTGVERSSMAYREELFGPVAMVFKVRDEDEAVEVANDTPYGLGSYVFSNDAAQAARVADRLDAGMVFVNGVGAEGVELPFGGVKRSGFGRELGRFGIEEFVNKKLIRTVR